MTGLLASLVLVAVPLAAAALAGRVAARALWPPETAAAGERTGWGILLGLGFLAGVEALALAASFAPRPTLLAGLALFLLAAAWLARPRTRATAGPAAAPRRLSAVEGVLLVVVAAGVLQYALRALSEPMWSNDFLAIWGLKGKAIFGAGRLPWWLSDAGIAGYSHPEYPLGLPLLFAALASVAGRWDDQALALLFPVLQIAGLALLFGWLRRRGASLAAALAACAVISLFEPLYSAFLTGMAEVPLAAAALALGMAFTDAVDAADSGAVKRLALAAFLAASVKNEGFFLAAAAGLFAAGIALVRRDASRWRTVVASIVPAAAARLLTRWAMGPAPLRDFDFGLLAPARAGELFPRIGEALAAAGRVAAPAWPGLLCVAVLLACGRRTPAADRLLGLAAAALLVYLLLPALAVLGPRWLVEASLARTSAALAPLVAAGIAGRYAPASSR